MVKKNVIINIMKLIIEYLGTLFLVCVILWTGNWAAIGAALAIGVYLGGKISGGAFNPAVSVVLYLKKAINLTELMEYITVQIAAGITGYYLYEKTLRYLK